jgi:hypothetical protein
MTTGRRQCESYGITTWIRRIITGPLTAEGLSTALIIWTGWARQLSADVLGLLLHRASWMTTSTATNARNVALHLTASHRAPDDFRWLPSEISDDAAEGNWRRPEEPSPGLWQKSKTRCRK